MRELQIIQVFKKDLEQKIQREKSQKRIERLVQTKHKLLQLQKQIQSTYSDSSEPKPD